MKSLLLGSLLWPLGVWAAPLVGHLSSPAGALPALRVYAWSSSGRLFAAATAPGQSLVRLDVPAGRYRVFATPADPGVPLVYLGHTTCSSGEDAGSCQHDLRWISATDGASTHVDINDWHIDDAQAQTLDRALHREAGTGDSDPSIASPRFFEYPGASLLRAHASHLVRPDVRPEWRARLADALAAGHINFAGRASIVELPCGNGCVAARIVDLETGRVTAVPTGAERQGLLACPERLAYRRDSRLLRVAMDGADGAVVESYYVWEPDSAQLRPLGIPASATPSRCTTPRAPNLSH